MSKGTTPILQTVIPNQGNEEIGWYFITWKEVREKYERGKDERKRGKERRDPDRNKLLRNFKNKWTQTQFKTNDGKC